uniref:Uncharacterized protein n=1 Tax=Anguilla anguilla TaxID=7936 RepID=A0A0E9TNN4_ANGAN
MARISIFPIACIQPQGFQAERLVPWSRG